MVTHCFSSFSIPCKHLSNSFFSPNHVRTILIWQVMHHEIEQNSSCMAINSLGIFWNCKVCNLGSPMGCRDPMTRWGGDVTRISSRNKAYDGLAYGYVCVEDLGLLLWFWLVFWSGKRPRKLYIKVSPILWS